MRNSNPSFYDWARANDDPDSDSYLKEVSLREMTKKAASLEEKIMVYVRTLPGSKKVNLLADISKIDAPLEKWKAIINDPNSDSALKRVTTRKIKEAIPIQKKIRQNKRGWWGELRNLIIKLFWRNTFEEYLNIFENSAVGSKHRKCALWGMRWTTITCDPLITYKGWQEVYGKAEAGSKIEAIAFSWMEKLGKKQ
jgi:hypothetical protein